MFRSKGWFSGGLWKPKNPHSLEHLKYLYHLLSKNQTVNEQNKGLLVETLRSIAEILIWGDQNDSTVFDFFLEKNMLSYFLKIMKQKCGRYVCVQLLQTLNILFENIRNETSLYYLLSNNHVNSIIVHKFDFSDEEVMAYYISFLKTLSLKLNTHTIHFFYNEHTNDFPLYTEAIKFFNHGESMVRIAVRTLTLNVFKVDDKAMLKFIRNKTAAPYFSNLVWFIGNHVLELDSCVRMDDDHQSHTRLADLVGEHLDHLHYLNDILCLQIDALNDVLTCHLLNRLLVPLYVYSLTKRRRQSQVEDDKPHVSSVVSLFLLSQVFLIISHQPLVRQLAHIILNGGMSVFSGQKNDSSSFKGDTNSEPEFVAPEETLEKSLESKIHSTTTMIREEGEDASTESSDEVTASDKSFSLPSEISSSIPLVALDSSEIPDHQDNRNGPLTSEETAASALPHFAAEGQNITDEEKAVASRKISVLEQMQRVFCLSERPFLEAVFNALECTENDHAALFALCLLYALGHNPGINQDLLDTVLMPTDKSETKQWYNINLVDRMIKIISLSCQYNSRIRLSTLQMSILLLKQLVVKDGQSFLQDRHLAAIEQYREDSTLMLRNFYKSEEIFLDMFDDEYQEMKKKPLNVEYLMMDANLLLPPTGTPMSGVEFHKRLPCGEVERARRAIRVFFLLRDLSLTLQGEVETRLPLTNLATCINVNEVLDLNNSDLIACTVVVKDGQKIRRFMVIEVLQLILVEPDTKRLGWGVAKFVGFLQDIEVTGDKDDSRCLHITVHRPASAAAGNNRTPLLAARFVFDDHIRCMAAKQRLTKGRLKARQRKMHQIARLLDLPDDIQPCPSPLRHGLHAVRDGDRPTAMHRSQSQDTGLRGRTSSPGSRQGPYRPLFTPGNKVPGYATILKQDETGHSQSLSESPEKTSTVIERRRTSSSPLSRPSPRSRDSSPRQRVVSGSEEIPLEDMSRSRGSRHNSPNLRRRSSSGLPQARISAPPGICHVHHLAVPGHTRIMTTTTVLGESSIELSSQSELCRTTRVSSVQSDQFFMDDTPQPIASSSPKLLHTHDASPLSLVSDSNEEPPIHSPRLLPPFEDVVEQNLIGGTVDSNPESPMEVCTKPCCASETTREKHDIETLCSDKGRAKSPAKSSKRNRNKQKNSVADVTLSETLTSDGNSSAELNNVGVNNSNTVEREWSTSSSNKLKGAIHTV